MIKRQKRLQRIADVAEEYQAAQSALELLTAAIAVDPSFGRSRGWETSAALAFERNLSTTYIIRIFAEFEAGIRDYWQTHLGKQTSPKTSQLIREAIPNQSFSRECVDGADEVREFRNFLVHDPESSPPADLPTFSVAEAKRRLCEYFGRLDARWK